jgi:hypothetical protein
MFKIVIIDNGCKIAEFHAKSIEETIFKANRFVKKKYLNNGGGKFEKKEKMDSKSD